MIERIKWILCFCVLLPVACFNSGTNTRGIPDPQPESVEPPLHNNETDVPVVIKGKHFIVKLTRQLSGRNKFRIEDSFLVELRRPGEAPVSLRNVRYVNPQTIKGIVPAGIAVGTYGLGVTTPYGLTGTMADAYVATVADAGPPSSDEPDPPSSDEPDSGEASTDTDPPSSDELDSGTENTDTDTGECVIPADCLDDSNECTERDCQVGTCVQVVQTGALCLSDGNACNGVEYCDSTGACLPNQVDPCLGGGECADDCHDLGADTFHCFRDLGSPCTSDNQFCNGVEACNGTGGCTSPGDPCIGGPECADTCDEDLDTCDLPDDTPCSDGDLCTTSEYCEDGACISGPYDKDADEDDHIDSACGGDDCDDTCAVCWEGHSEDCDGFDNDCNPATLDGWDEFSYRRILTIDAARIPDATCTADLARFPILVSLSDDWLKTTATDPINGRIESEHGYDIVFKQSDGTTPLSHEIETYSDTQGTLVAWVSIPTLDYDEDTDIYLSYGNTCFTAATERPTDVWDANYLMVQHLAETSKTSGGYNDHLDSTVYGHDGEAEMLETQMNGAGHIAGANDFDRASGGFIDIKDDLGLLNITGDITVSAWAMVTGFSGYHQPIVGKGDFQYMLRASSHERFDFFTADGSWNSCSSNDMVVLDQWYYLTGRVTGTDVSLWVNGIQQSDTEEGGITSDDAGVEIGRNASLTTRVFVGTIDEVRISNIARSACWIETSYNNQSEPLKDALCTDTGFICLESEELVP